MVAIISLHHFGYLLNPETPRITISHFREPKIKIAEMPIWPRDLNLDRDFTKSHSETTPFRAE